MRGRSFRLVFVNTILPLWVAAAITFALATWYTAVDPFHASGTAAWIWIAAIVLPVIVFEIAGRRLNRIDPPERYRGR